VYTIPNTVRVIKSRRMRWAGHVAHIGQMKNVYRSSVGKPEKKRSLGRLGVDASCVIWVRNLVSHFREEHRLRVFENRVLTMIFGSKREEDGSWRKLHNDELYSLYSSPNTVRVIKSRRVRDGVGGTCGTNGGGERCLQDFGWKARM
jgi:hypothetical protein